MRKTKIEVCCASAQDAINAEKGGADRIELNSAIAYGGLTPGLATIEKVKKLIDIPVMVMIRPRSGGFSYSKLEFEIMKEEIKMVKKAGADGVAFGILNEKAEIDYKRNKILQEISESMITVFHRAFDIVPKPFHALDKLNELGFNRVLTSAQVNKVQDNLDFARDLVKYGQNKIEIVLAGGIRNHNVVNIVKKSGTNEIHFTAFNKKRDKSMKNKKINFNASGIAEDKYKVISKKKVQIIKNILDK